MLPENPAAPTRHTGVVDAGAGRVAIDEVLVCEGGGGTVCVQEGISVIVLEGVPVGVEEGQPVGVLDSEALAVKDGVTRDVGDIDGVPEVEGQAPWHGMSSRTRLPFPSAIRTLPLGLTARP